MFILCYVVIVRLDNANDFCLIRKVLVEESFRIFTHDPQERESVSPGTKMLEIFMTGILMQIFNHHDEN